MTSHGKGVVDGVGGRVKSSVHAKVMSLGKKREIVQDAESFCKLASTSCNKNTVIYVGKEEIDNYQSLNPFEYSVPVNGIFKMHIMAPDGKNTFLWPNAAYQKIDPPTITILNSVEGSMEKSEDSMQQTSDIMDFNTERIFSYHDVVKVVKGNYSGYYDISSR